MRQVLLTLATISLAAFALFGATGLRAQQGGEVEAEALALIDAQCASDDIAAEGCACHRDVFRARVLDRAENAESARLAAMIQAMDAVDQRKMMMAVQEAGPGAMDEAAQLLMAAKPELEACDDAAREAQKQAEREADLPQGDDPRARFVRQCARENGQVGVCECVADSLLEKLGPLELGLMADMQAAEARGEEAIAELAEERGMTPEEAKQALMMMSGRISAAMISIDPMACAMAAR